MSIIIKTLIFKKSALLNIFFTIVLGSQAVATNYVDLDRSEETDLVSRSIGNIQSMDTITELLSMKLTPQTLVAIDLQNTVVMTEDLLMNYSRNGNLKEIFDRAQCETDITLPGRRADERVVLVETETAKVLNQLLDSDVKVLIIHNGHLNSSAIDLIKERVNISQFWQELNARSGNALSGFFEERFISGFIRGTGNCEDENLGFLLSRDKMTTLCISFVPQYNAMASSPDCYLDHIKRVVVVDDNREYLSHLLDEFRAFSPYSRQINNETHEMSWEGVSLERYHYTRVSDDLRVRDIKNALRAL